MELAKLQDGQLIYGTYEECEDYAYEQDTCVDRYFYTTTMQVVKMLNKINLTVDL